MHGEQETSQAPRWVFTLVHLVFFGIAAWIYFGGGAGVILGLFFGDQAIEGNLARRVLLLSFGAVLVVRMYCTVFCLLKRKFGWEELGGVLFALFIYQDVFALMGAGESRALDSVDILAVAVFIIGSYLNSGSEWQRKKFKDKPENQGKLYTGGLFRYARHINYFGDTLWVAAWALVTRNRWAAIIPVALAAGFIFGFIPPLTRHLEARYGEQFKVWEKATKRYIPFIY